MLEEGFLKGDGEDWFVGGVIGFEEWICGGIDRFEVLV